jgi:hypothetical protein
MIKLPDELERLVNLVTNDEYLREIKPELNKVQRESDFRYNQMIIEEFRAAAEKVPGLRVDEFAKKVAEVTGKSERRLRRIFRKAGLLNG